MRKADAQPRSEPAAGSHASWRRVTLLAAIGLLVAACAGDVGTTTTPPPASEAVSTPSATVSLVHSPDASPASPVSTPSLNTSDAFPLDAMIRASAAGIALRDGPGLIYPRIGILRDGSRSFVMTDPIEADGYVWQRLAGTGVPFDPANGCATAEQLGLPCAAYRGWAAIGEVGQEPWFELDRSDCPDPSTETRDFMMLGDAETLHCYAGRELEFTAWVTMVAQPFQCPVITHPVAWLACTSSNPAHAAADPAEAVTIELFVEPGSGADFSQDGYWAVVIGAVDNPAAQECAEAIPAGHPINSFDAILDCRARFVVSRHVAAAP